MGLILDTCILINVEKTILTKEPPKWSDYGDVYISSITASELLIGVHLSSDQNKRFLRSSFVENVLSNINILPFTTEIARIYADIFATLRKNNNMIGTGDLMIGATSIYHDYPVLTYNKKDFSKIPGIKMKEIQ